MEKSERGYLIANRIGMRASQPVDHYIGILKERKPLFGVPRRALYIGRISVEDSRWSLEIYRRVMEKELRDLFSQLAPPAIDLEVTVMDAPWYESYVKDLDFRHHWFPPR